MEILRKLFGPSKNEIWKKLADEIGAEFHPDGFGHHGKVELKHGEWVITLDTLSVTHVKVTDVYTRIRAPFVNKDDFHFRIYHENIFHWIEKQFGAQDIVIGDPFFDEHYVVQGHPEILVKHLLRDKTLKELIERQTDILLEIKDDEGWFAEHFPKGVHELYFQCKGEVKDWQRLKDLFDLFVRTLDLLCLMGSAYHKDPQVHLE